MYVRKHTCKTVLKFQMMKDIAQATEKSTNQYGSSRQISEAYFESEPKEKNGTSFNENSLGWTNSIKTFVNSNNDNFLICHLNINYFIVKFLEINELLNLCYFDILFFQES